MAHPRPPRLLTPPEGLLQDRLRAMAPADQRRLVRQVKRISRARHFYYKDPDRNPVGLIPMVLDRRMLREIQALTRSIFRFQMRAPSLYRANLRGFADLFKLERRTQAWFDRTGDRASKPWELLIRPDYGFRLQDGGPSPVLFELNSLMLGGIYLQTAALDIIGRIVLPRLGARPGAMGLKPSADLLELVGRWLLKGRRQAAGRGEGGIAFLEGLPPGGGFSELPHIARFFAKSGILARHGDPRDLELRRGQVVLRGMSVAYAYRDFSYEDVGGPDHPRLEPFARLWREGRVTPGFPADFDQKGILECFTSDEFEGLFTREEARRFREHVPWTRVLSARRTRGPDGRSTDLPGFVLKNQEKLVIKPSWSSGGDGILIGRKTRPERWRRALESAVKQPGAFAVQSYVDSPPRPSAYLRDGEVCFRDCRCTLGSFFDGSRFGFHLRMSPKDIVNVAQGGALAPVYFG